MNMRMFCTVVFVAGLLTTGVSPANAYPVTFEFSGTINSIGDSHGLLDGSVVLGTPFAGSVTFESTMTDDLPDDPHQGVYTSAGTPSSISMALTVGSYRFAGGGGDVLVQDFSDKDTLRVRTNDFASEGFFIAEMGVRFGDFDGTALASDALPMIPPVLALCEIRSLYLRGEEAGAPSFTLGGTVATLTPEPISIAALAIGGLVLLPHRRRICRR